jgi:hypothetical protein
MSTLTFEQQRNDEAIIERANALRSQLAAVNVEELQQQKQARREEWHAALRASNEVWQEAMKQAADARAAERTAHDAFVKVESQLRRYDELQSLLGTLESKHRDLFPGGQ